MSGSTRSATGVPVAGLLRTVRARARRRMRGRWHSIRSRLALGFGVVVLVLGLVTLRAYVALRTADRDSRAVLALSRVEYEQAQRVVSAMSGELAAGMQYANSGSDVARARYETRAAEFDTLRLGAMRLAHITASQRARLEDIGRLQGALEVRIGIAHVNQAMGRRREALAALDAAAGDLAALDTALVAFRAGTAERVARAQAVVSEETARSELSVGALSVLAIALAVVFSGTTARAIAAPLAALVSHAGELRRGNFAARTVARRMPGEFALLGTAMNRAAASLDALQAELTHQAYHDPLTGLANRAQFGERATRAVGAALAAGCPERVAVLVLDLDGFKTVNDSLGHAAGDRLLTAVAARLLNATRGSDTVARLGGDEFAVLLENVREDAEAAKVAERIVTALGAPYALDNAQAFVGASVGIARGDAVHGAVWAVTEALLRDADVAMYRAKARGKGQWAVFEPLMHAEAVERLALEADLRAALATEEAAGDAFRLVFQPVVDVGSGQMTGVEALVRWAHPRRGLLAPSEFLAVAEETGLVVAMGRWVLREACRHGARWQAAAPISIAVNVSGRQLHDAAFVGEVASALEESGLAPEALVLELTEHTVVQQPEAVRERLVILKLLGVRLAIDDFGTGYSALSYLRRFPVDVLKIDKSFVDGIAAGGSDAALARTIVALGEALSLRCVAEGVETSEQRAALQALGCPLAQGYHFARPLGPEAIDAALAALPAAPAAAAGV